MLSVRARRGARTEQRGERQLVLGVDQPCERVPVRVLAQVPGGEPAELPLGDEVAGFRHSAVAEVGGIGEHSSQDRARVVRHAPVLEVREAGAEPGPAVHLGEQVGDADRGQLRVERGECGLGLVGRGSPERADAELARTQRDVLELALPGLVAHLCQSTGEKVVPLGEPGLRRVRGGYRQRARSAHGREHPRGDELLLDRAVAPATFDPDVARPQPIAQLDQHAELVGAPVHAGPSDRPTPALANEPDRRVGRQFARAAEMEVAHDRQRAQERAGGGHRAERERGDERRPDPAEDREVARGELDRVGRVALHQPLRLVDLAAEILPADNGLDRGDRVVTRRPGRDQRVAEPGEQPDLGIDGAPVALHRRLFTALDAPEHLPEQAIEHQHRIVGEGNGGFERGRDQGGAATTLFQRAQMLAGEPRPFLTQPSQAVRVNGPGQIAIEADRADRGQPVEDARERALPGFAGRLPRPGEHAEAGVRPRRQQRIEPVTLISGELSGKQLGYVPLRVEQGLRHHALDERDPGHDRAPTPELVDEQAREVGAAGRGKRDRQQPSLELRPGGSV